MNDAIAKKWMQDVINTVKAHDYIAHMQLISKSVNVTGVPGFENINYDDWAKQCKHEFDNLIIKSIHYQGYKNVAETATRIMFKTYETVEATDGAINSQGIEVLLENEEGQWRVTQQRILPEDEVKHDKLLE